ncbi:unnamed protein product [Fraxinus pennsylvanica]|uniref:MADS-box domain-containing protein n=1 Tax=Fraxinus pennsylvanica TaxID=56036 RepID=A0AAD1ZME9_9LAMI|nr:unnamed protein product [Fraxinus pennsylvanica]
MERRTSRGRRKIEIHKIENEEDRYATFSKRRVGLIKKASELCTLCDVDMGIIISSPTGKPFSFFHPTMESVLNRYYHKEPSNNSSEIFETYVRSKVNALNETLDEISEKVELEMKRAQRLNEIGEKRTVKGWWEAPVQELNREQVQQMKSMLENFINQANYRMEKLRIDEGFSSSSTLPQGNIPHTVHPGFFPNADLPNTFHPGFFPNADPNASAGASMHPQGNFLNTVYPGFFSNASTGASLYPRGNSANTAHSDFFPNASAGASMHPQGHFLTTVQPGFFTNENSNADPNARAGASMFLQGNFYNTVHSSFLRNANADPNASASAGASVHPQGNFPNTVNPDYFPNANTDADPNASASASMQPQGNLGNFSNTVHPDFFTNENANVYPNASAGASSSGAGHGGASFYNPLPGVETNFN